IKCINEIIELINKSKFLLPFTHKRYIQKRFYHQHGYEVDLEKPTTFSEKIQWLKLYGPLHQYTNYVDKYEVRSYVKQIIGERYLIPNIGVYDNVNKVDINSLPEKFIIKATHGCGWNLVVKDKSKLDWNVTKKKINKWIKSNYFYLSGERNYYKINGRIIIEEFIEDKEGDLKDYKFYCFHGEPKFIMVNIDTNKSRKAFFDTEWNRLSMNMHQSHSSNSVLKPYHLDEMLDVCRKLSGKFPLVRVDLYYTEGRIYFGELTFTPGNGFNKFSHKKYDLLFGEQLHLSKVVNE
ncbi:glycosyl transferase, partial [Salipaludibacillus sp. CUR1]|uniref:ATP-grasp fold amidoligase family protein n=1 Tax=Salipaludibacillus sp. CUR1 TaxID=2820003 RepID=UPI001E64C851